MSQIKLQKKAVTGSRSWRAAVLGIALVLALPPLAMGPALAAGTTPHAPVKIEGNAGFTAGNGVISGDGSLANPYVVDGWAINATTAAGIYIGNTTAAFVLSNLTFTSSPYNYNYSAIELLNAPNGRVESVLINGTQFGVHIESSTNTVLSLNRIESTSNAGIGAFNSNGLVVVGNSFSWNNNGALLIGRCNNTSIIGNTVVDVPSNAMYLYESDRVTVADGNWSGKSRAFEITASTNVSIVNNTVSGSSTDGGVLESSNFVTVASNRFVQNVRAGLSLRQMNNANVSKNTFSDNGNGLMITESTRVSIGGNLFTNDSILLYGFSFEQLTTHIISADNMIDGLPVLHLHDCDGSSVDGGSYGQVFVTNCTNVRITNLTVTGKELGLLLAFVDNATVAGNSLTGNWVGMLLNSLNHSVVSGNVLSGNNQSGARLSYVNNSRFEQNQLTANLYDGLLVSTVTNLTVASNNISANGRYGAWLTYASRSEFKQNDVRSNSIAGLTISNADRVSVESNVIVGNNGYGAIVGGSTTNTTIDANTILGNSQDGLFVYAATGTLITRNLVDASGWNGIQVGYNAFDTALTGNTLVNNTQVGVLVNGSYRTATHHNNFMGNAVEARETQASGSRWDDGYPAGGNYWAADAHDDNFSGVNQNVAGSDGIVDVSRPIDGTGTDQYPLAAPVNLTTRPTVAFVLPLNGAHLNTTPVSVTGMASATGGAALSRVEVRINGGFWQTATGTSNWYAVFSLLRGDNVIEARSWDDRGSPSLAAELFVNYNPNDPPSGGIEFDPFQMVHGVTCNSFIFNVTELSDDNDPPSALEWRWDWEQDGVWDTGWMKNASVPHDYCDTTGRYQLFLQIRDTEGLTYLAQMQIGTTPPGPPGPTPPPPISSTPLPNAVLEGEPITITAVASRDLVNTTVVLWWQGVDEGSFRSLNMTLGANNTYSAVIPKQGHFGTVSYYFEAVEYGNVYWRDPQNGTYTVEITEPVEPEIWHSPPLTAVAIGSAIPISVHIPGASSNYSVVLFYESVGSSTFVEVNMTYASNGTFEAQIPAQNMEGTVRYFFLVTDPEGRSYSSPFGRSWTIWIEAAATPPVPPPFPWLLVGGGLGLLAFGAILGASQPGRYVLQWILFGRVFARLKKESLLSHFVRGRLYQVISQDPGVHFSELRRLVDVSNGTATHHLHILQKGGYIRSETHGMLVQFYPTGERFDEESYGLAPGDLAMVEAVEASPGLSESDLAKRLSRHPSAIQRDVARLERLGYLVRKEGGPSAVLFARTPPEG